jgi:hypothetical protein
MGVVLPPLAGTMAPRSPGNKGPVRLPGFRGEGDEDAVRRVPADLLG